MYRLLTQVSPAVYGSKLAHVLVEASRSPLLLELPEARLALLAEAIETAVELDEANPYRAKVLAKALDAHRREQNAAAAGAHAQPDRSLDG